MQTKALIVCVSMSHGNTARIAEAMADVLGARVAEPEEVDPGTVGAYDVVGFGSGIYYGSHHPRLRRLVEELPACEGTRAFVFSTSGQGREQWLPWQSRLGEVLAAKGYDVVGSFACRGYDTWLPLRLVGGIGRGHPDARDLTHAHDFARQVAVVQHG